VRVLAMKLDRPPSPGYITTLREALALLDEELKLMQAAPKPPDPAVVAALGLDEVPPELRGNRGEIEAARSQRLPRLVALADLQGDLHTHTDATDGRSTIEEMALGAHAGPLILSTYMGIPTLQAMPRWLAPDARHLGARSVTWGACFLDELELVVREGIHFDGMHDRERLRDENIPRLKIHVALHPRWQKEPPVPVAPRFAEVTFGPRP
jgi:hypothetical protein